MKKYLAMSVVYALTAYFLVSYCSGCTSVMTKDSLTEKLGYPTEIKREKGLTVYRYLEANNHFLSDNGNYKTLDSRWCRTNYYLNDSIVINKKLEGNNCK